MSSGGARFRFSSPEGYQIVQDTVRDILPYTLHAGYQLEGICKLLDGSDPIVLLTGAGKTAYYVAYMLMLLELEKDLELQRKLDLDVP